MESKKSKTKMDDMPAFDDELDSLDFDDSSFLDDSDPAIPVINDTSDLDMEGDLSSGETHEDDDALLNNNINYDLDSDFAVDLNDFQHADGDTDFQDDMGDEFPDLNKKDDSENGMNAVDEEDEGPISLSEDELDNILGDADLGDADFPEIEHGQEEPGDTEAFAGADDFSMPRMNLEDEDEADIALSSSELDNILGDTDTTSVIDASDAEPDNLLSDEFDRDFFGEDAAGFGGDSTHELLDSDFESEISGHHDEIIESADEDLGDFDENAPAGGGILEDEDEGPIALTPEELGNIEQDVGEEETAALPESDEGSILDDEDEGPIAFDESEMASILEIVTEEEHVPSQKASDEDEQMPYEIDLDEMEASAPALEDVPSSGDVKKEELKKMISYLDSLFDELPDETVLKFSNSEYFELYKKIMSDLGLHK